MTNIMLAPYSPAIKTPPPVFDTSPPPLLEPAVPLPFNSSPSPPTPPITSPATSAPLALSSTVPLPTNSEPPVTPFLPPLPSPSPESLIAPDNSPTPTPPSPPTLFPAEAPLPSPVASASQPPPFPPGGVAPALPTPATFAPPEAEAMPPERRTTSPPPSAAVSPFTEPPLSSTAEPPEVKLPPVPLSSSATLPVAVEVQKLSGFNMSSGFIVGLLIGAVIFVFVVAIVAVIFRNRREKTQRNLHMHHHHESSPCVELKGSHVIRMLSNPSIAFGPVNGIFTYDELVVATNSFSEDNLVGQGGFGYVYKGILPCGKEIAVKHLKTGSQQGDREFQAEVETISRVHHKHPVELVGYCVTNAERLIVYEFIPNNTLEFHLHGEGKAVIEWATRIKIALGSAKGLAYLREDCNPAIIHRDIKASNILLDSKFEPKVRLAKLFPNTDGCITHLTTRVVGTFGYLAPEYASSGKLTDKSDVYSYGVMLLELITGRLPITTAGSRNESLVDWARPLLARALQDGDFNNLVDSRLQKNYGVDEMARMITCAAACVRHSARLRPRMSQIVGALEGLVSLTDLVGDITPGHTTLYSWSDSSTYDASQYQQDLRTFNLALSCHKYSSTGHGESTSPYGLHPSGSSSSEVQQTIRDI